MIRQTLEHRVLYPETRKHTRPLLLLHGAWHGAWCWQPAMEDFARRGFEVHAISLRGHGKSDTPRLYNLCSLNNYVTDLTTAVSAISPAPVVVGHSLGGFVLQLYIAEQALPGAVLLCSLPAGGALGFLLRFARRHPLAFLKTFATLNTLHMVGKPELARDAFFRDDIPADSLANYTDLLVPEAFRIAIEVGLLVRPDAKKNHSPVLAIAAEQDRVFTLAEERATAAAYNTELIVVPGAAHDLMLDPSWPAAANAIERFVKSLAHSE